MSLFVVSLKLNDYEPKILVYRDIVWGCYMLPHLNISTFTPLESNDSNLLDFAASTLSVLKKDVLVDYMRELDLKSWKHSEFHKTGTTYNFSFYLVRINNFGRVQHLKPNEFEKDGKTFRWMTISEMEADENTRIKNIDVTRHIADNRNAFFMHAHKTTP